MGGARTFHAGAKPLMRRRGRPKSLKAKFKPLLRFLNAPAAWMRTCGIQFDSAGKRAVDEQRRQCLAALRRPLPTGSVRDLAASLRWVREQHENDALLQEEQFDTGVPRNGWTVQALLDAVRDGKIPRGVAQKHINAIRATPKWASRRLAGTEHQVREMNRFSRDPSLFEPPPLTDNERWVLQAGGPPAVRLLLGRMSWLFESAYQNRLLALCDLCRRRGVEPPRAFLRGPRQRNRKDCDHCQRIPAVTRWRIRQRTRKKGKTRTKRRISRRAVHREGPQVSGGPPPSLPETRRRRNGHSTHRGPNRSAGTGSSHQKADAHPSKPLDRRGVQRGG